VTPVDMAPVDVAPADVTRTGAAADADPIAPGDWLAPGYRVLGLLSRGEAIDVYDVWSEERDCRCVAKSVRPDRACDRRAQRALVREGRLLRRLSHPHIVRCYDVLSRPAPVVILETLTGETLGHVIASGVRLRLDELAVLGLQLCSAIRYLHRSAGVLHLDLKPSNVIAEAGRAKLIDLGIARRPGRGHRGVGTAQYLAPEQARGDLVTEATDVWGIGVVVFEAATGRRPFEADDAGGFEQLRRRADSVRRYRRLPSPLAAVIDRCLEPDPARRPRVGELARALSAAVGAHAGGAGDDAQADEGALVAAGDV
jgi:serine/threonine protein kinase